MNTLRSEECDEALIIVWFRDDLRLSDHPALDAATHSKAPVICLYVLDEAAARPLGGATRWWLAQSLRAIQTSLKKIGGALIIRSGSALKIIVELAQQTGARAVFWNDIAQASHQMIASQLATALKSNNIEPRIFPGDLLV